jgi:hypothetical protein
MKPTLKRIILYVSAAILSSTPLLVCASDISEATPTGGLSLSDSAGLTLDAEQLSISPTHIHIEYVIRNDGTRDIVREAAFHLPAFDRDPSEQENALDGADVNNPLALVVKVDGKSQAVRTDKKTLARGDGMASPIQITRTWTQTFPAGRALTITLDYEAAAGVNAIYPVSATDAQSVCMSEAARKTFSDHTTNANDPQYDVRLDMSKDALSTGPLKRFTLILNKDTPKDLVSLCFPGDLQKASSTRFVAERENFTPPNTLRVLFLSVQPAAPSEPVSPSTTVLSKDQARDLLFTALRKHPLSTVPVNCMDVFDGDSDGDADASRWEFDVHEKHDATCGGDPRTSPRLFSVRVDKHSGALSTDYGDPDLDFHPMAK